MRKKWNRLNNLSPGYRYYSDPYNDDYININCPSCNSVIHHGVTKCPNCGEIIDRNSTEAMEAQKRRKIDIVVALIISICAVAIITFILTR